jgi:hypothetical protein
MVDAIKALTKVREFAVRGAKNSKASEAVAAKKGDGEFMMLFRGEADALESMIVMIDQVIDSCAGK